MDAASLALVAQLQASNARKATLYASLAAPPQPMLRDEVAGEAAMRSHPDVLAYLEFKDVPTVLADLGRSNWASVSRAPWFAVSYLNSDRKTKFPVQDPQFAQERGIPFMRFSGGTRDTDGHQRLIAAHLYAPPGTRHAFCRYVIVVEADVVANMTELGVKLPGFAGTWDDTIFHPPHAGTRTFSWRMEHGPKTDLAVKDYLYDGSTGAGFGNIKDYGDKFVVGDIFTVEQELDVDAQHGRVWINDVLVGERTVVTDVDIQELFLNVYHGGTGYATAPIHYRLAAACIAKRRIGMPKEIKMATPTDDSYVVASGADVYAGRSTTSAPAWRQGLTVGQWHDIPGTSMNAMVTGKPSRFTIDAWCGLANVSDANRALWVAAANGGHSDSSDNGVYGIDFLQDAPAWTVLCAATPLASRPTASQADAALIPYYSDGKPTSRHSYYTPQFCAPRNRVILPLAAAIWHAAQNSKQMDGFDLAANTWDPAGTFPDAAAAGTQYLVATHPVTGDIYVAGLASTSWWKWTQATNSWALIAPSPYFLGGYHGGMVDGVRNRLVRSGSVDVVTSLAVMNLSTLASSIVSTGSAMAGEAKLTNCSSTIEHDTHNDKYYIGVSDGRHYLIDPATFVGTRLADLPALPGSNAGNAFYNRFAYFPKLGGIAYYPNFASDIYFYPTE